MTDSPEQDVPRVSAPSLPVDPALPADPVLPLDRALPVDPALPAGPVLPLDPFAPPAVYAGQRARAGMRAEAQSPPSPPQAGPGQPYLPAPPDLAAALSLRGLFKRFGATVAVAGLDLDIPRSSFYGIVGPNGAGKTTTLSMATGLLTPDHGTVHVHGVDLWAEPRRAKPMLGILPDGLRTFDRLTGPELISYSGLLRGMDPDVVRARRDDLVAALDLVGAGGKLVADYSAGMTKKITLACALVHAPRVLVLDEPFEAVDPLSAQAIRRILNSFVAAGGTVVMSSHVMALVEQVCDRVAVVAAGRVIAAGTLDEVRSGVGLERRFVDLLGVADTHQDLSWLRPSSD